MKWTVQDRFGNAIYLTEERWRHILESRPELEPHFDRFLETLRELLPENNHLVVIVIFKTRLDEDGNYVPNNFVVTGWAKYIRPKK